MIFDYVTGLWQREQWADELIVAGIKTTSGKGIWRPGSASRKREEMGEKYCCHPANFVSRIWRGPVHVKALHHGE